MKIRQDQKGNVSVQFLWNNKDKIVVLNQNLRFYIHGSMHRESNIIVQQVATYSVYYISVGSSTCFGCRHPSSGARTTVITASGVD
jgi:hypothetical protein